MDLTFMTETIDSKTNRYINKFIDILDDEEKDDPIVIMELHIEKIRHKVCSKSGLQKKNKLYNKIYKLKNKIESDIMRLKVKEALLNEDLQHVELKYCNNKHNNNSIDVFFYMNRIIMLNNEIKENDNSLNMLNKQLEFVNSEIDILLSNSDQVNHQLNQYGNQFSSIHNKLNNFNKDMEVINSNINGLATRKENILLNSTNII